MNIFQKLFPEYVIIKLKKNRRFYYCGSYAGRDIWSTKIKNATIYRRKHIKNLKSQLKTKKNPQKIQIKKISKL